tara:strand:- start:39 stop:236 length:198 start_codon:yes stop_codon:yes gene_type:complete
MNADELMFFQLPRTSIPGVRKLIPLDGCSVILFVLLFGNQSHNPGDLGRCSRGTARLQVGDRSNY